jgi:hypothetical protein
MSIRSSNRSWPSWRVVNPDERARLLRSIGDHKFNEFAEIRWRRYSPMRRVNPKFIADYTFRGDHRLLHAPGVHQAGAVTPSPVGRGLG